MSKEEPGEVKKSSGREKKGKENMRVREQGDTRTQCQGEREGVCASARRGWMKMRCS